VENTLPVLSDILAVILGGGRGARLYPLTKLRSKPAVPIAGKYRLIDIPLSNCINSGIYRVVVLTQFNSVSLHRHITATYQFDTFHTGWVQILAAEQTLESADWYQGTADAVRKQLFEIGVTRSDHVLILAGDHLYRMDYAAMVEHHWQTGADITVAVQPVSPQDASRLGILKRDEHGRIIDFVEKPIDPVTLDAFASYPDPDRPLLGSMGIYLFKMQVLVDLLTRFPDHDDFGADVIPHSIGRLAVYGFEFDGYWRDVGTIRSFYETNLELALANSPFNFFDPESPIYTHARFLPGSSVEDSRLKDVLLSDGCRIRRAEISHSVIGVRSQIASGTHIINSILMGADYYTTPDTGPTIPIGIGSNCSIEGAILDKNVRLGEGVIIRPFPRGTEQDNGMWVIRDGIVIIPKDTEIQAGTHITPKKA
jgi:glucose-1-phosphate adenylyltransferase